MPEKVKVVEKESDIKYVYMKICLCMCVHVKLNSSFCSKSQHWDHSWCLIPSWSSLGKKLPWGFYGRANEMNWWEVGFYFLYSASGYQLFSFHSEGALWSLLLFVEYGLLGCLHACLVWEGCFSSFYLFIYSLLVSLILNPAVRNIRTRCSSCDLHSSCGFR